MDASGDQSDEEQEEEEEEEEVVVIAEVLRKWPWVNRLTLACVSATTALFSSSFARSCWEASSAAFTRSSASSACAIHVRFAIRAYDSRAYGDEL